MRLLLFIKRIAERWAEHDNTRSAAAIGFYAIFTLAPMLVFATAGLGLMIGPQEAQSLTEARLAKSMGPSGARVAKEVLASANFSRHGSTATVVSGVVLLYAASAFFLQIRNTLDRTFGLPQRTTKEAIVATILSRAVAALCVIVGTLLLIATLVAQVVLDRLSEELVELTRYSEHFWQLASTVMSVVIVSLVVVAMLKYLPSRRPAWRHVLWGAVVSVVLFELGKWLFGIYVSRSVIASAYGPSSAIVAFIIWIYYSTQIFILGAEISQLAAESEQPC